MRRCLYMRCQDFSWMRGHFRLEGKFEGDGHGGWVHNFDFCRVISRVVKSSEICLISNSTWAQRGGWAGHLHGEGLSQNLPCSSPAQERTGSGLRARLFGQMRRGIPLLTFTNVKNPNIFIFLRKKQKKKTNKNSKKKLKK